MPDKDCIGSWTVATLKEYIEVQLTAHERLDDERHAASDKALEIAFAQNQVWKEHYHTAEKKREEERVMFFPRTLGFIAMLLGVVSLVITLWQTVP